MQFILYLFDTGTSPDFIKKQHGICFNFNFNDIDTTQNIEK